MAATPCVLLVEDNQDTRGLLDLFLRQAGYAVTQAADGQEAVESLARQEPDVVLCDLRLPRIDGIGVLKVARERHPHVPVIVMSGAGLLGDAIDALRLGALDYITKPITEMVVLEHALKRALAWSRLTRENEQYRRDLERTNEELRASLMQLERDEEAGRLIQFRLLPAPRVTLQGIEVVHALMPSAHLSGDFVDCFPIDERHVGFYLADVAGHGVPSAFVTVFLKSFVHRLLGEYEETGRRTILSPQETFHALNHLLLTEGLGKHLTIFYGVIDTTESTLTYANASQFPWPVLFDGAASRILEGKGQPVGLFGFSTYAEKRLPLGDAFVLSVCSDGVLDLLPEKTLREKVARLERSLGRLDVSVESLTAELGLRERTSVPDDVTMLMVRRVVS